MSCWSSYSVGFLTGLTIFPVLLMLVIGCGVWIWGTRR